MSIATIVHYNYRLALPEAIQTQTGKFQQARSLNLQVVRIMNFNLYLFMTDLNYSTELIQPITSWAVICITHHVLGSNLHND